MIILKRRIIPILVSVIWLLAAIGSPMVAMADDDDSQCVVVIYPQVAAPYRAVFEEIISGISEALGRPLIHHIVDGDPPIQLSEEEESCGAYIGLARLGIKNAEALDTDKPIILGAIQEEPGKKAAKPTISLVPSPEQLFTRLKYYAPQIKNVNVVYNPENRSHLIQQAKNAAEKMGLKLVTYKAFDLKEALPIYRKILFSVNSQDSALWLLQDESTAETQTVLPTVLKEAWRQKLLVFSSQAAHAKRGVFFSVYPDNHMLGITLGNLVNTCMAAPCKSQSVLSLQNLRTAVNRRTAARLGIQLDYQRDPYMNLVFPAK